MSDICFHETSAVRKQTQVDCDQSPLMLLLQVEKFYKNMAIFESQFLGGKFIGGDELCIADFKLAPLVACMTHKVVKTQTGYFASPRLAKYLEDFYAAVPSSAMLKECGGFSLVEWIDSKKGALPVARKIPPPPYVPP